MHGSNKPYKGVHAIKNLMSCTKQQSATKLPRLFSESNVEALNVQT